MGKSTQRYPPWRENPVTEDNDNSKPFRKMADDIMHNANGDFGGAFVLVPPKGAGNVIATLVLDNTGDAAQFWSNLQVKCKLQLDELATASRNQQAGFRR